MVDENCGYVCINVQIYSDDGKKELMKELAQVKGKGADVITYNEVENARNCIVMLTRTPERPEVTNADALTNILSAWKLSNKKLWLNELDMAELADKIIEEVGKG